MLTKHKKFTAVALAVSVLLTAGIIEVASPVSPFHTANSENLLKTPSQDGAGEALTPQKIAAASLSENKLSYIDVKLPKSSHESDISKPKHQLLVKADIYDAKQAGGLNIAENNDWNVPSRDSQDFAYKYPKGSSSFTALVNVSKDNKLVALSSSDAKIELTALAAFSDVEKAVEKPTIVSQDEQQLYQALDIKPSSSDLTSTKGKLAPGGVKTITPFVMYDNQNGIGSTLGKENIFSPLGKADIPYSTRGDVYPVRAVMLTVQATDTSVTIDGNVIEQNSNKLVIAKVDENGYIQFSSSNPNGLVKITASGYIGASFESESQTVVEGGVVVLGSNSNPQYQRSQLENGASQNSDTLEKIDNVLGGAILSSFDEPDANYEPSVTIDNVGDIKLGENVSHKLTGTVEAGPALQNIAIYANSQFITTANIDQTVSPARWFATISIGVGSAEISAVANTYNGKNASASTRANGYDAPDSTTSMVSEDTYTVSGDQLNRISQESENFITFAGGQDIFVEELDNLGNPVKDPSTNKPEMHVVAPGDIVVLGTDSTKVSGGNSRRVVAVDKFPSKLVLTVTLPSLDEQFLQLNINQNKAIDRNDMKSLL
ncbi:MAG: hypothetical protein LBB07_01700, partial [Bifidobacteriaceae bacterium]|nr:hypothetical protein [Bifidobacteriaceae bacterium]